MKFGPWIKAVGCVAGLMLASAAHASEVLYDGIGFIVGNQSVTDSFALSGPGTLTVTLTDFAWPSPLYNLDMVVATAKGMLGPEVGTGTQVYNITSATTVYAQWFGTALGSSDAGLVGLKVQWQPAATTVPLPTSVALLLSGLGLLVWQRRHREAAPTI